MPDNDGPGPTKLSLPLEFQQDIFRELREEDELVVIARGLGLLRIVMNLLHSYDAAGGNLVVLVGADERENGWIGEALAEHAVINRAHKSHGLGLISTDLMSVENRQKLYARGGVYSITSQILVVDLLSGVLDPAAVTGLVILHAEKVVATSTEAFIVRTFRQKNKHGFLKAFSDGPEPLTMGYSPLTTMMRNLFLRKPALYPRFHVTVASSLEGKRKAEVIELEVPMTDAMKDIQNAVLDCIAVSIGELKKGNPGLLDVDEWADDIALHKNFDTIIRRQLQPHWHRTTYKTRQIVRDLGMLRSILHYLLSYDAVSFNRYLDTVLAASSPPPGSNRHNQSPWLFLDSAHTMFDTAKRRVYTGKITEGQNGKLPDSLQPVLEELPKWSLLAEILEEIEGDMYLNPQPQDGSNSTVLIMCGDQATCRQLREYLQTMSTTLDKTNKTKDSNGDRIRRPSGKTMMRRKLRNYLAWKRDFARVSSSLFHENQKAVNAAGDPRKVHGDLKGRGGAPPNKRRRVRGGGVAGSGAVTRTTTGSLQLAGDKESHLADLMADLEPTEHEAAQKDEIGAELFLETAAEDDYYELYDMHDVIVVHPYDGDMDEHVLDEIKPRYVIMYEPDAAFIRRVEVYRSSHSDRNVRVYFMYYGSSVEERRYLDAVRREKDAFTKLIRERGVSSYRRYHRKIYANLSRP